VNRAASTVVSPAAARRDLFNCWRRLCHWRTGCGRRPVAVTAEDERRDRTGHACCGRTDTVRLRGWPRSALGRGQRLGARRTAGDLLQWHAARRQRLALEAVGGFRCCGTMIRTRWPAPRSHHRSRNSTLAPPLSSRSGRVFLPVDGRQSPCSDGVLTELLTVRCRAPPRRSTRWRRLDHHRQPRRGAELAVRPRGRTRGNAAPRRPRREPQAATAERSCPPPPDAEPGAQPHV
jgi:hypothetical protein